MLTAETLCTDFLDLWTEHQLPTKSVLLVTHNIEEAVLMCDRIPVLLSNPRRVAAEIPVSLSHPRNRLDIPFRNIVDEIYAIPTSRAIASITPQGLVHGGLAQALPRASVSRISGLIRNPGRGALCRSCRVGRDFGLAHI